LISALAISAAVSVAAENMGGELVQPIGKTSGKATRGSSPSATGNTTPRRGISSIARLIR
jgi:hypothetical protein